MFEMHAGHIPVRTPLQQKGTLAAKRKGREMLSVLILVKRDVVVAGSEEIAPYVARLCVVHVLYFGDDLFEKGDWGVLAAARLVVEDELRELVEHIPLLRVPGYFSCEAVH